jgi:hypothetical protein
MPPTEQRIIVLAKMKESGLRPTGRHIQRDRNLFPEMESFMEPHALMYINRERKGDLLKAQETAARDGWEVVVYPKGTRKPLEKAKAFINKKYGG